MKLPITNRFAIPSFLCITALALVMGVALSSLLTRAVSEWEWENTAALARRQMDLSGLDALLTASPTPEVRERWGRELSRLFAGLPEIVRIKVWDREGIILWSDEARLIGERFPGNRELGAALAGRVSVEIKELAKPEHAYEQGRFAALAEVYVPIFSKTGGDVLGVLEIYKTPVRLFATIHRGRIVIWTISIVGGLALYLVLLPLVRQVYGREVQEETLRGYAGRLEHEVAERTRELQKKTDENVRLFEETQRRLSQTETLLAVGQAVGSTLDLAEIGRRTTREMVKALGADMGGAWFLSPDRDQLLPLAGYHVPKEWVETFSRTSLSIDDRFVEEANRLQGPICASDSQADPRFDHPFARLIPHKSVLVYPMWVKGEIIGGFAIIWVREAHRFTSEELRLGEGIARQAAIAVENARLLEAERVARERLQISETRYRELFETVIDIVYLHDLEGRILAINEAGVRVSGYSREELLGMNIAQLVAHEDLKRDIELIRRMIAGERISELFTAEFIRKDGTRIFLECSGRLIRKDGAPVAIQGVARDVTARRRLEERQAAFAIENARLHERLREQMAALKRVQVQLVQSTKLAALGELAAQIAHEINNPLTSVLGYTSLALQDPDLPPTLRGDLEVIAEESLRTRRIVRDLLDFARRRDPRMEPGDLNATVRSVIELLREPITVGNVVVVEKLAPLPPVSMDSDQLKQVFINLITNALDAMPDGGTLTITTGVRGQGFGDQVEATVADTGIGMSLEEIERIFDPFYTTKNDGRGTGLGLSVSRGIVEGHGGRILVESQPGRGSVFRVILPLKIPQAAAKSADY
jgi:PAS domain S-box-containing protein